MELVDVRLGDARDTLAGLAGPVDMLVFDGRNDLYVSILETVRPRLTPGLASTTLAVDAGIELTVAVVGLAPS